MRPTIIKSTNDNNRAEGYSGGGGNADPFDKYDDLAEEYEVTSRGDRRSGSGGKKRRDPRSETFKKAREEGVNNAEAARKEKAQGLIKKDLQHFPVDKKSGKEKIAGAVTLYSDWVMASLQQGELIYDAESDFDYKQVRSQGPGGQNVNKVSSAVVCVHKISGIGARSEISRNMPVNKAAALGSVQLRLEEHIGNWSVYLKGVGESEREAKIQKLLRESLGLEKSE